jgi:ribosomal protein S18 acetylase RimI-like enzyme
MDALEIAKLEEFRRAKGAADLADSSRSLTGGGAAMKGKRGSWINYAVGIGLSGPVSADELAEVTKWWMDDGIEPRLEIAPFVDYQSLRIISDLGYTLRDYTNMLYRELSAGDKISPVDATPRGLELRVVDPADADQVWAYCDAVIRGFKPDIEPTAVDHELSGRFVRHPQSVTIAAIMDGRVVGGGSMGVHGQITALLGASVLPDYRRRGIQQAVVAARLNIAAQRGVKIATIGSLPGAATERNARRMGFQVAYTKVILTRHGEGLVGTGG